MTWNLWVFITCFYRRILWMQRRMICNNRRSKGDDDLFRGAREFIYTLEDDFPLLRFHVNLPGIVWICVFLFEIVFCAWSCWPWWSHILSWLAPKEQNFKSQKYLSKLNGIKTEPKQDVLTCCSSCLFGGFQNVSNMFCRSGADNVFHHCKMCSNRKEALVCGFLWFRSVLQCQKKGNEKPVCKKNLPGRWWTKSWRRQSSWTSCLIEETWGWWGIEAMSWHFFVA